MGAAFFSALPVPAAPAPEVVNGAFSAVSTPRQGAFSAVSSGARDVFTDFFASHRFCPDADSRPFFDSTRVYFG
jgi:hypothetical protein